MNQENNLLKLTEAIALLLVTLVIFACKKDEPVVNPVEPETPIASISWKAFPGSIIVSDGTALTLLDSEARMADTLLKTDFKKELVGRAGLSLSPDKTLLFFSHYNQNTFRGSIARYDLALKTWKFEPLSNGQSEILPNTSMNGSLYFLQDSFVVQGARNIYRNQERIHSLNPQTAWPARFTLTADERYLLIPNRIDSEVGIFRLDLESGTFLPFITPPNNSLAIFTSPVYAPDGNKIALIEATTDALNLTLADSDGSNPTVLLSLPGYFLDNNANLDWSPDGQYLVAAVHSSENVPLNDLIVVKISTGEQRLVCKNCVSYAVWKSV